MKTRSETKYYLWCWFGVGEKMRTHSTVMTVGLCCFTIIVILCLSSFVAVTEKNVKPIPKCEYHRPLNTIHGARNFSSNFPLCGLSYESFIFNISSGKWMMGVKTINKSTPNDLCKSSFRMRDSGIFTIREELNYKNCLKENSNPNILFSSNYKYFQYKMVTFFLFLDGKQNSSIIEIGGFKGGLTELFLGKYEIPNYVVVEPIETNRYVILNITKLLNRPDVGVYQFGLGRNYREISVRDRGDATSLMSSKWKGNSSVKIVNAIDFFILLGVACHDIDLLTINCEGCEFDVLEMLASTNLIDRFVHIQFQPHCRIQGLVSDCSCRYCRIRQLLARTHEIAYSFTQVWEAWRRKPAV